MRKNTKKLFLKSETVRVLTDAELGRVQGGMIITAPIRVGGGVVGAGVAVPTTAINCTAYCKTSPPTTAVNCGTGGGTGPTTTAVNCGGGTGPGTTAINCR
jgi:hypothetical protein